MHVFINFQHSAMSWEVGSFTINIILSKHHAAPKNQGGPFAPADGMSFTEGSYRIGSLLGASAGDKWWQLLEHSGRVGKEPWRASSYSDPEAVVNAAVDDVTRDIRAVFVKFGISPRPSSQGRG